MKLLELYALACGLKIGDQFLLEKFYPLENHKYISIQAGSGMGGKNYPYYNEVIDLILPILKSNKISIVQIGGVEDLVLNNCVNLLGKTDLHQTNFIISRSLLHIGNDSFAQHRLGYVGVPIIDLFGPTTQENHSPYQYAPNSIFLSSHRNGKNPTFASQENPQSIAMIKPEEVANAILKVLGVNFTVPRESIFFGSVYNQQVIE